MCVLTVVSNNADGSFLPQPVLFLLRSTWHSETKAVSVLSKLNGANSYLILPFLQPFGYFFVVIFSLSASVKQTLTFVGFSFPVLLVFLLAPQVSMIETWNMMAFSQLVSETLQDMCLHHTQFALTSALTVLSLAHCTVSLNKPGVVCFKTNFSLCLDIFP